MAGVEPRTGVDEAAKTAQKPINERRMDLVSMAALPPENKPEAYDKYYEDWVENGYDELLSMEGYVSPGVLAGEISEWVQDKSKRLLDCASGSGLLGEELKKLGFTNIDACDLSQGSLDFSRRKNVYKNFICAMLGPDPLPIEDNTNDGVCMTGGFWTGHVQPDCLPEWVRITKTGGLLMFMVREPDLIRTEGFCDGAMDSIIHKMAGKGSWEFLMKKRCPYLEKTESENNENSYMYVLRVL